MNIKYRIISLISTLALVLSCVSFVPAYSAGEDVNRDSGKESYDFLKAVGIIGEDEEYSSASLMTRGHFVKLALGLAILDTDILSMPASGTFSDVLPSHAYASEIEAAYSLGIISGNAGGSFEPDSTVTYAQAAKILCDVLGYTDIAVASGGYPAGYIVMASRVGILDGMTFANNAELNMGLAMQLLKNAAESDVMEPVNYGDTVDYVARKGRSVLTERKGIESIEGIISANGWTDLRATESELDKNCIRIDETVLNASDSNAADYLGYKVKAYYDDRSNKAVKPVLYVSVSDENDIISCDRPDKISINGEAVEYEVDDSTVKKIRIEDDASYILNGKMAAITYNELSDVEKGSIEFVSNDGDQKADVVHITSYETYVLSGVSTVSNVVVCDDGTVIELDSDDESYTTRIMKNGTPISLSAMSSGNVILAAISEGEGLGKKEVLFSDASVSGNVTEKSDDTLTVESTRYNSDTGVINSVSVGKRYKFLIDYFGNIASVDNMQNEVYGYLYGLAKRNFDEVYCKIFTENNRWVELEFDSKIKFDGEPVSEAEAYALLGSKPEDYRELIRYRVNSDGEVSLISTPKNISGTPDPESDAFTISYEGSPYWRSTPASFDGIICVDSSTVILSIPENAAEEDIKIVSMSNLDGDRKYNMTVYDMDEHKNAGVIVIKEDTANQISSTNKFVLVKSVGEALNTEGDKVAAIRGWWNGVEMSFTVKAGDEALAQKAAALKKGDVILFSFDDNDDVVSLNSYALDENGYFDITSAYSWFRVAGGIAEKTDYANKHINITYNSTGSYFCTVYNNSTAVYIYDKSDDTYTKGTVYDVVNGDKLIVKMRYLVANEIIVFRD